MKLYLFDYSYRVKTLLLIKRKIYYEIHFEFVNDCITGEISEFSIKNDVEYI